MSDEIASFALNVLAGLLVVWICWAWGRRKQFFGLFKKTASSPAPKVSRWKADLMMVVGVALAGISIAGAVFEMASGVVLAVPLVAGALLVVVADSVDQMASREEREQAAYEAGRRAAEKGEDP